MAHDSSLRGNASAVFTRTPTHSGTSDLYAIFVVRKMVSADRPMVAAMYAVKIHAM